MKIKKGHVEESCSLNLSCYIIYFCFILHIQPTLNLLSQLEKHIGRVLPEFTPADLTALQEDLAINLLVTSKVETGIQQKSI